MVFVLLQSVGVWAVESGAAGKLDLKLRLKPGQKYGMRIIEEDKISQTIMGRQQDVNHIKATGLRFEVEEVDANSIATIKLTYQTLREKTNSWAGGMEYDSTKPCTAADNPLAQMYTAMMGESFIMKVTPEGKIIGLNGIDEMFLGMAEKIIVAEDKLITKAPPGTCSRNKSNGNTPTEETQKEISAEERAKKRIERINKEYGSREKRIEVVKEMIKKMPNMGEDQFRNMLSNMIMVFPDRPVGIGDSWMAKMILASQSLPIEIDGTCTVKGSKKGVVIVDVSSKRNLDDEAVPIGKARMKIAGSYQGTSEIDEASGWMMRSKANMHFSGEMKMTGMAGNKQMPQGMTVPMSIESLIAVEPMELE
ncbi:MAG: hypothetical protein JXB29_10410 [Sedimentisphaerales bacterium]|nr:hypothetical protein [Sedimentisphaerales bacterium]